MKRCFYSLVILLLVALKSNGQDINYTLIIDNASCNLTPDGAAQVVVVQTNPPYTYVWDFGETTNAVNNLPAGNYSVRVADSLGNDTLISVEIRASGGVCKVSSEIAFTPNGDGFNDVWLINNIEHYPDNFIVVFNVWGQKVFESSGLYIPWNGNDLAGVPVPENSYYYVILMDKKNKDTAVKGCISILR